MDISQKIAKLDELDEVAQGLMLICELPQVRFATFQFIQSRPDQYASPFVRTTYPEKWVNHYLQHNLMHSDPIVRHSLNRQKPFFWSEVKLTGSVAKFDCVFALCQCCAIVFIKDTKAWSYS